MNESIIFVNFLEDKYSEDVAVNAAGELCKHGCDVIFASHSSVLMGRRGVAVDKLYRPNTIEFDSMRVFYTAGDQHDRHLLDEARLMFLRSTDRVFLESNSIRYLECYFDLLIDYWTTYLINNNVAVAVFESTPHFPWDIPLFYVAKSLGINILIIRRTFYSDAVTLSDDYRSGTTKTYVVPEDSKFDMKMPNKVSVVEKWSAKVNSDSLKNIKSTLVDLRCVAASFKYLVRYTTARIDYFHLRNIQVATMLVKRWFGAKRALDYYRKNARIIEDGEEYVIFALHFRPERSTVPEGGRYCGQLEAIKRLRAALPGKVCIVVKEHPRQLGDCPPDLRRIHQHEISFYEELVRIPNTVLVPIEVDQNFLISNSLMTASISGSVVWEGLLLGKPGITFGNVWHSECLSSPDVSDDMQLTQTIQRLFAKSSDSVLQDVASFVDSIGDRVSIGARSEYLSNESTLFARKTLVEKLSHSLVAVTQTLIGTRRSATPS